MGYVWDTVHGYDKLFSLLFNLLSSFLCSISLSWCFWIGVGRIGLLGVERRLGIGCPPDCICLHRRPCVSRAFRKAVLAEFARPHNARLW
jgi:hypothetical protein